MKVKYLQMHQTVAVKGNEYKVVYLYIEHNKKREYKLKSVKLGLPDLKLTQLDDGSILSIVEYDA